MEISHKKSNHISVFSMTSDILQKLQLSTSFIECCNFFSPEELVICPYDPNHKIMRGRLGFHLVKCRKNHTGAAIAVCDYNQEHRIPKPELKYHLETCEDRIATEARPRALQEENVMSFPIVSDIITPAEQSWNQLDHPGYDSEAITDNHNVLRLMAVEKPSMKKQFRAEEQRRMNAIRAPNGLASASQGSSSCQAASSSRVASSIQDALSDSDHENVSPTSENKKYIDEKPKCSLEQRLASGIQSIYVTAKPEETEWTLQTNRKNKK